MLTSRVVEPTLRSVEPPKRREVLSFGQITLDLGRFEIRRADEVMELEPKAFDLLVYLVRHPEQVITKDDLARDVWQQSYISESVVTRAIALVRKAIGDNAKAPVHVVTVWRRGYRFEGEVTTTYVPTRASSEFVRPRRSDVYALAPRPRREIPGASAPGIDAPVMPVYTGSMSMIPPLPAAYDGEGRAAIAMRYEDVAQDGRVLVESLATSVNESLWRGALRGHPLEDHVFSKGTLAILSRFVIEGTDGPFHVDGPFEAESRFALAHSVDEAGEVARIYLNAWVDTYAPIGRTNFAPPSNAGTRALVGRAFAEHVFTRPFAPASERKVTELRLPGSPAVPPHRHTAVANDALLAVPTGAVALDETLTFETQPLVFGLRHTDSNQHVNSLVYPQLFEEAALRRFAAQGLDTRVLARSLEIAYRKPCFAGQRARIALATFRQGETLGAYGGIYAADEVSERGTGASPHATLRMTFTR